jgi:hypothetical protein
MKTRQIDQEIEKIIDWRTKYGMLERDELEAIAGALINYYWGNNDLVVEIGMYKGRTTQMMAAILQTIGARPPIVSIDAFERVIPEKKFNCRGNYSIAAENIVAAGYGAQCVIISAGSNEAVDFIPPRIGFLIIDGWHSLEQCARDLANYMPKVKTGGRCLVDDYCDYYPGVVQAVDEYAAATPGVEVFARLNKGIVLKKV